MVSRAYVTFQPGTPDDRAAAARRILDAAYPGEEIGGEDIDLEWAQGWIVRRAVMAAPTQSTNLQAQSTVRDWIADEVREHLRNAGEPVVPIRAVRWPWRCAGCSVKWVAFYEFVADPSAHEKSQGFVACNACSRTATIIVNARERLTAAFHEPARG